MMRIQAPLSQFIAKMGGELMLLQCGRIVSKRSGVFVRYVICSLFGCTVIFLLILDL
ncbi:hypothetical protein HanIR_Chr03g0146021 [Helianthus annuus]|nr:hypothetical protein HanIR_Chr03g0146021 [Helianthus annuus]